MSAPTIFQARSRLGVAIRSGNKPAETEARRDLAAAKIAQYIEKIVAEAPPLSPEQRTRLAGIIQGGAGNA